MYLIRRSRWAVLRRFPAYCLMHHKIFVSICQTASTPFATLSCSPGKVSKREAVDGKAPASATGASPSIRLSGLAVL